MFLSLTKSNNLFTFLKEETPFFTRPMVATYALAGIFHFLIIATILLTINSSTNQDLQFFLFFCFSIIAYVRINKYSMDRCHNLIEEMISGIRERLTDKIRKLSMHHFERLGQIQLNNVLTQELVQIAESSKLMSTLFTSTAIMIAAVLYLAYLSLPALAVSSVLIVLGIYAYRVMRSQIEKDMIAAKEKENEFFTKLRHILEGFKEIKINDARNNDLFYNHLLPIIKDAEQLKKSSNVHMNNAVIFAQTFCYILMGVMIFVFPRFFDIQANDLIQIVTLILFITTGPLGEVVSSFPMIERANISIRLLKEIEHFFETSEPEFITPHDQALEQEPFDYLECKEIRFQYAEKENESSFHIGPINLRINRGEIIFIMGGNGAGKSTFFHILTGLYPFSGGSIEWNGHLVHSQNLHRFRSNFAVIYQDMHLFDRVYGVQGFDSSRIMELLRIFHLDQKTGLKENGEIKNLKLSVGQKKRLALILAELDQRDIHIYDEWAADQDPVSRKYFYEEYLQDLKKRGKTIVAVTHDDKYYDYADRLFLMEYGSLMEVTGKARR